MSLPKFHHIIPADFEPPADPRDRSIWLSWGRVKTLCGRHISSMTYYSRPQGTLCPKCAAEQLIDQTRTHPTSEDTK
jgi:hypothetical protein